MTTPIWIDILLVIAGVAITLLSYYLNVRRKIREAAEGAINAAEELNKIGEEKMQIAIEQIYVAIPIVAKPFISKTLIREILQEVFDNMEKYAKKQMNK